uniref:Spindle and centriole-associated protein 1 n=1 Tax=Gorilla gorilla gorilla TaxID=9595 RepID=G3SD31_GORGO
MSFVRVNRCGPRVGVRKIPKVKKKKTSVKQEWDNTVTDLTVHRATPEDLVRRHEIHKSKNRALVHWELQEKALKRKWRKQKPETLNLEKRRLSIMKEILSDQYQMQDVLEKSDHLIAAAKELFPRRRTGFPNVTVAPDSSQGPIVVNQDPITQSIFNESVIEPQALNDVDGEEEGTVNSQSGESENENELDNSLNSQSNTNTDRYVSMSPNITQVYLFIFNPFWNCCTHTTTKINLLSRVQDCLQISKRLFEIQLRKEVETRQQLEQVLGDHRELIDALTAEILRLREENAATQARLQQYMVTTDEQLISLTHAIKNCPVINNRQEIQASESGATGRRVMDSPERPVVNANVSVPLMFREEVAEFPQEELPVKLSQVPDPPDNMNLAKNFPAHIFEPAVLLTPPRQKSNLKFSPLQDVLRRTVQTRPAPRLPPTVEIIEKEQNWEEKTLPIDTDIQNSSEENRLFTQRWRVSHMGEDLENKTQAPFVNLSQPLCNSHSNTQQSRSPTFSEELPVLGDGQQLRTNESLIQRKDIMTRIADLTLQNSAIKAHMNNIIEPRGEQGDGPRELNKQESASDMTSTFPVAQSLTPGSMEERIAELNRQSMEARGKLLQLIEQQKLVGLNLSPPMSPVQLPLRAWTEGAKRTIEVSLPGAETPESSKCSTVSPVSGINTRRSSGATGNSCSPLNATSGSGRFTPLNPRAKIEKQNEEGWFALSTHVS